MQLMFVIDPAIQRYLWRWYKKTWWMIVWIIHVRYGLKWYGPCSLSTCWRVFSSVKTTIDAEDFLTKKQVKLSLWARLVLNITDLMQVLWLFLNRSWRLVKGWIPNTEKIQIKVQIKVDQMLWNFYMKHYNAQED